MPYYDIKNWTDAEIIERLNLIFDPAKPPLCPVCGEKMAVKQLIPATLTGCEVIWACDPFCDSQMKPGRSFNDGHYNESMIKIKALAYGGQQQGRFVLELIRRFQECKQQQEKENA